MERTGGRGPSQAPPAGGFLSYAVEKKKMTSRPRQAGGAGARHGACSVCMGT